MDATDRVAGDVVEVDTNPLHRMTISKMVGQTATKDNAEVSFIEMEMIDDSEAHEEGGRPGGPPTQAIVSV